MSHGRQIRNAIYTWIAIRHSPFTFLGAPQCPELGTSLALTLETPEFESLSGKNQEASGAETAHEPIAQLPFSPFDLA